jgi:TonB-dependent receptor
MRRRAFASKMSRPALRGPACLLMAMPGIALAQGAPPGGTRESSALEEVTVTGYRRSLENSADAKRESVNFTDSVFAEDIGKFPDLNIAESVNRIPGIQLTREVNGEGLNIAIRGLGTSFTKVVLNNAQIAVASSGRTDEASQNRELDLDLFPTELFTRLDVSKTPRASLLEGGVSGTVNMRSARPFDNPGTQFSYQLQGGYGEISEKVSPRGSITASWTNDTFGVLAGVAAVRNKSETTGYETIGWTNPNMNDAQCGSPSIDHDDNPATAPQNICQYGTGGNNWTIPATVPDNPGGGLTPGTTIDKAFLEANNPGVTAQQIGDALMPRLGRPAYLSGNRDRLAGLLSFEFRPTDSLQFYLDTLYADADRSFDRLDMNLVGRNGSMIPLNMQLDENNVVTSATFANAQFFLEARPYEEEVDFYNINPGMHFDVSERIGVDFQLNKTHSQFFREAPTVLFNTPSGVTVQYQNGTVPVIESSVDLNDPNAGWTWAGGRVNIQNERRVTDTEGGRLDVRFGRDALNVQVGAAFDDVSRRIVALDNSREWQQLVCGGGGPFIPAPAPAPGCNGAAGSAVPQSSLASYLQPGPAGFITVDFDRFFADTNYHALSAAAPVATGSATTARSGGVDEKTWGGYVELNSANQVFGRDLRINAGVRYVTTDQVISGPLNLGGIVQPGDWVSEGKEYDKYLPSLNLAYDVRENIVARASASRTLTRPDPSQMIPAVQFGDVGATNANVGNPELVPFISDNIDLGAEWYTGAEGFIGLTLFQKKITGFTVQQTLAVPFRDLEIPFENLTPNQQQALTTRANTNGTDVYSVSVNLQQQVNASGELRVRGYEVTWVQPLGRWFEPLEGFGFNVNYSRVTQKGEGTGAPAQAVGVSPHAYNATAYYEKGPASIRLSYVWKDEQIASNPNQQGIRLAQLFNEAYGQLDLSASYELTNLPTSPQITLNMINITSETQRSYFQFPSATNTFYDPGFQIMLGVRGRF